MTGIMTRDQAAEYAEIESLLGRMLGYRVVGRHIEFLSDDVDEQGRQKVRAIRPVEKWALDLWQEAVAKRIAHDHACKDLWLIYAAAMGITIQEFNGLPAHSVEQAVKDERARLLGRISDLERQLAAHS